MMTFFGIKRLCFTLVFSALSFSLLGQTPTLNKNREIGMGIGLAVWSGVNYGIQYRSPQIPAHGNTWKTIWIDKGAKSQLNKTAAHISDVTIAATLVFSGLSVLNQERKTTFTHGVVLAQSAWMTANFAHSVKMMAKRNRPYTQAAGFQYSQRDDVFSFFSGHSAIASSLITSAMLMRKQPMSMKSQNITLASGAICGLSTLYLRFYAGKHYPTDILVGMLTGMGIAYLNYQIHAK